MNRLPMAPLCITASSYLNLSDNMAVLWQLSQLLLSAELCSSTASHINISITRRSPKFWKKCVQFLFNFYARHRVRIKKKCGSIPLKVPYCTLYVATDNPYCWRCQYTHDPSCPVSISRLALTRLRLRYTPFYDGCCPKDSTYFLPNYCV